MATRRPVPIYSLAEVFSEAHHRLEAIFFELVQVLGDGAAERADEQFAELEERLRRHIHVEEELIFPVFETRARVIGPTAVMRHEHRRIGALLGRVRIALDARDLPTAHAYLMELGGVLANHARKEEVILYPKTDAVLSLEERAELLARIAERRPR
jgi:iron-sulfur cluster repair protein YtfE (RIC family)